MPGTRGRSVDLRPVWDARLFLRPRSKSMGLTTLQTRTHRPGMRTSDAANEMSGTPASIPVAEPPLRGRGTRALPGRIVNGHDGEPIAEPVS
jgi:hypothetical protein